MTDPAGVGRDEWPLLRAGAEGEATVTACPDGPLIVRGAVVLDAAGEPVAGQRPTMALCRCGKSGTKPFCDSTHKRIGFRAP